MRVLGWSTSPEGQLSGHKFEKGEKHMFCLHSYHDHHHHHQRRHNIYRERTKATNKWNGLNQPFSVRRCYIVTSLYCLCMCGLQCEIEFKKPEQANTQSNFPLQGLTTGNYHRRFLIAIYRTHRWKLHLFAPSVIE